MFPGKGKGITLAPIGNKLRLYASCQDVFRGLLKKKWSEPLWISGKGATINLMFGFRCCLTIPKIFQISSQNGDSFRLFITPISVNYFSC